MKKRIIFLCSVLSGTMLCAIENDPMHEDELLITQENARLERARNAHRAHDNAVVVPIKVIRLGTRKKKEGLIRRIFRNIRNGS